MRLPDLEPQESMSAETIRVSKWAMLWSVILIKAAVAPTGDVALAQGRMGSIGDD